MLFSSVDVEIGKPTNFLNILHISVDPTVPGGISFQFCFL